jgi:hypothetical protein
MARIDDLAADFADYRAKAKSIIDKLEADKTALEAELAAAKAVPPGATDEQVSAVIAEVDAAKAELGLL